MLFNIWNPARIGEDEIAFDVTRANMPRVSTGDTDWIAACLEAIDVSAPARDWSIQPARCHFYSDYPDESAWEDRWPETWIVRVELDGRAPDDFGPPTSIPDQVDQYDRSWNHGDVDDDHDRTALVLLLFRGQREDATSVQDHLLSDLPPECDVSKTRLEPAGTDWFRLRIVVRGTLFPERVEALESVLREGRRRDCIVNRNEMDSP